MTVRRALWPLAGLAVTSGLALLGWDLVKDAREVNWPSQARSYDFERMDMFLRDAGFEEPKTEGFVLIFRDSPTYVFWATASDAPNRTGPSVDACKVLGEAGRCAVFDNVLVAWRPDGHRTRFLVSWYPTYASESEPFLRAYRDPDAVPLPVAEP